ncbi:hypothetical protein B484DRAFT_327129 [Ochromonadaceae sp. CCMP2298]|nr:hypothetical protein B484DRAFT_327129 [Ochromonadaceae sp. CCMP2298]
MNLEFGLSVRIYTASALHDANLSVRPTTLPNCDFLGLFANKSFETGDVVCRYVGDWLRTADAIRLKDKSYLMRLGEQSYVDARPHDRVLARYINDCINQGGWNVEFVKLPEQGCALVVATRPIAAWEELFVSYGKRYWMLQRPIRLSNAQLRAILLVAANAGGIELANGGDMSNTG